MIAPIFLRFETERRTLYCHRDKHSKTTTKVFPTIPLLLWAHHLGSGRTCTLLLCCKKDLIRVQHNGSMLENENCNRLSVYRKNKEQKQELKTEAAELKTTTLDLCFFFLFRPFYTQTVSSLLSTAL